jgi:thioredoxin-like negative regulator of GroEL
MLVESVPWLSELAFLSDVVEAPGVVVVAFLRKADADTGLIGARLAELEPMVAGRARLLRIDAVAEPGPARLYRVRQFPTLVFFRNGLEIGRLEGLRTAAQYALAVDIAESALPGVESVRSSDTAP